MTSASHFSSQFSCKKVSRIFKCQLSFSLRFFQSQIRILHYLNCKIEPWKFTGMPKCILEFVAGRLSTLKMQIM